MILIMILFFSAIIALIGFLIRGWFHNDKNWRERARQEEKELRQSLRIVKSINKFNHWIFKFDDDDIFIERYKNNYSGAVSNDRLASLKMYDQFIDLGDHFFNIKNGVYNLPNSFFSKTSLEAKKEIEKIEQKKKLLLEAVKRRHITSTEAVLTVRQTMKLYYKLIAVPLTEIANLDMQTIFNENKESNFIIEMEKEKIKHIKNKKKENTTEYQINKLSNKRLIRDSKRIISEHTKKIDSTKTDLKLRKYLIKHQEIQMTAREFLNYLQELRTPIDPNITQTTWLRMNEQIENK